MRKVNVLEAIAAPSKYFSISNLHELGSEADDIRCNSLHDPSNKGIPAPKPLKDKIVKSECTIGGRWRARTLQAD